MPYRSSKKRPRDLNRLAAEIVAEATREEEPLEGTASAEERKNPAAVELGRLGGRKGGRVRAERLTGERRSEIARKAARARWESRKDRAGSADQRSGGDQTDQNA